jgi:dihydroflavonol-4-reductase
VNLVDVRDVAAGLILAMERGRVGQRYIFGGESVRLRSILKIVGATSGRRHLSIAVPGKIAEIAAGMLELVADHVTRRPPSGTAEGVRIALRSTELSIDKARNELGYLPRPVEPALRETLACLRAIDTNGEMFDMGRRATRVPAE